MIDYAALNLLLDGVAGYLHPDEPAFLAGLAAQVPPGQVIVEVGSFRGRSTIALAFGAQPGVIVYAVDPHEEHEVQGLPFGMADNQAFMSNVSRAGMGNKIRVVNLLSRDALVIKTRHDIGLVFVDGAHEYSEVGVDSIIWGNALVVGGLLAFHDSTGTWAAPTQVADGIATMKNWTELEGCAYTRVFRKEAGDGSA
jgi:predicted O-methyltransferase YrrM